VDKGCCRSNTRADASENIANLHTLNLKASILRRYGRNIESRPAQIDSGAEVKFTPDRSVAAISVNWNERTRQPNRLENFRRTRCNEFDQLLR
jgi:hypothetical protein